eukprot:12900243-Prorocentrum_lima.AAC.1
MTQSRFMMFRRAMGEKKRHPEWILTREWWMQQYMRGAGSCEEREYPPDPSIPEAKGTRPCVRTTQRQQCPNPWKKFWT